jgi:hypothetical protein
MTMDWGSGMLARGARARGVMVACVLVLACPAAASANTVYAAPRGAVVGQCSSPASACEIHRAVGIAQPGDNVALLPGDYTLSSSLSILGNLTVYGAPGHQSRIQEQGDAIVEVGNQAVMQDIEVDAPTGPSTTAVYAHDATLDRMVIKNAGTPNGGWAYALVVRGVSSVLDSLLIAPNSGGMGLDAWNGSVTLRNDDIFGFAGMRAYYDPPNDPSQASSYPAGNVTVNIRNSILHATSVSFDGEAYGGTGSGAATIDIDFSNFSSIIGGTVTSGQNNQTTTAPTYANAGAGDYREAPGSVTIDAGITTGLGPLDLAGDLRAIGAGPDIGAFEHVIKGSAATLRASPVTPASAILHGSARNGGAGATYRFNYGLTSRYGSHTPARSLAPRSSAQSVAAAIAGLKPGTRYHFQLVVTNGAGSANGADRTLTTPPDTKITQSQIDSKQHRASFSFAGLGSVTGFQCGLLKPRQTRASYSSCTTPKAYGNLGPGSYTFLVRALNAGGADPTPAKKTFRIS